MGQARLTSLVILSIEREVTERMNFSDVIRDFASRKAWKVKLQLLVTTEQPSTSHD